MMTTTTTRNNIIETFSTSDKWHVLSNNALDHALYIVIISVTCCVVVCCCVWYNL